MYVWFMLRHLSFSLFLALRFLAQSPSQSPAIRKRPYDLPYLAEEAEASRERQVLEK